MRDRASGTTSRLNVSSNGAQTTGVQDDPSISVNGRYVAFLSSASDLVPGDTNGLPDAFVRDRWTRNTFRVSVSSAGAQADGDTYNPRISANGRYVSFGSDAANLVGGDTNRAADVFVRDLKTATTSRISVSSTGAQADLPSYIGAMSSDGRYVAFLTAARNLVPGDRNSTQDILLRDRKLGTTTRVSLSNNGAEPEVHVLFPAISGNGRYVTFTSGASNLVRSDTNDAFDIFIWRRLRH